MPSPRRRTSPGIAGAANRARCRCVGRMVQWEKLGWILMAVLLVVGLPLAYNRAVNNGPDLAGFCDAGRYILEHGYRDPDRRSPAIGRRPMSPGSLFRSCRSPSWRSMVRPEFRCRRTAAHDPRPDARRMDLRVHPTSIRSRIVRSSPSQAAQFRPYHSTATTEIGRSEIGIQGTSADGQ